MSFGNQDGNYRQQRGSGVNLGARMIPIVIGLIAIGFTMARGCQQGPFGRAQVVAMNPQQEAQLGLQAFQEVLSDGNVVKRGPTVEVVREITSRLIKATRNPEFQRRIGIKIPEFEWDVQVLHENQVNAFCLPGGKMVVYTAILPVAENDAGLATVMGHEISHALAHHGSERMAQTQIANIGLTAAGASMGDMDPGKRQQLMQLMNAGAKFGILGYSRSHESEADRMGLLLMAAAGYDPRESMEFWKRMADASGGKSPPEFASTHPSHATRIHDLTGWIPDALPLYEQSEMKSRPRVLPGVE